MVSSNKPSRHLPLESRWLVLLDTIKNGDHDFTDDDLRAIKQLDARKGCFDRKTRSTLKTSARRRLMGTRPCSNGESWVWLRPMARQLARAFSYLNGDIATG